MQSPICEICLKSDILCGACKEKFDSGATTQLEIDISRFLFNLAGKVKSLADIKILKVFDFKLIIIITARGDGAKIVGRGGSIVKVLAKKFKKPIKVIEHSQFKEFIQNLLQPVSFLGVNTVYTLNGEFYKVRIAEAQQARLQFSQEEFSEIIKALYGCKTELSFE